MTVVRDGEKTWPPPPVQVSAAPTAPTAAAPARQGGEGAALDPAPSSRSSAAGAALLFLLTAFSPSQLIGNFTVFVLAIVIGYYVIGNVHHALHTPLMSVTNAISGIIIVGALLQIGHADTDDHGAVVRGDPARQHQHLRRLRRDPPACSSDVHRDEADGMRPSAAPSDAHQAHTGDAGTVPASPSSRRCCSSSRWPGCRKHETSRQGIVFGIAGMAIALAATIGLGAPRARSPAAARRRPARRRHGDRRRHRACGGRASSR